MRKLIEVGAVPTETRDHDFGDLFDGAGFVECPAPLDDFRIEGKRPNTAEDNESNCFNPASFESGPVFKN